MGYIGRSKSDTWHYAEEVQGITKCGVDGKAWVEWAQPDARPTIQSEGVCGAACNQYIVPWQPDFYVFCSYCGDKMSDLDAKKHYHLRRNGW